MIRNSTRTAVFVISTLAVSAAALLQRTAAQAPPAAPGGVVALTGGRVIDGTGRAATEQATILISNGKIQAVGAASAVTIPAGATRVDLSGKTIMPGMINAHAHLHTVHPAGDPDVIG